MKLRYVFAALVIYTLGFYAINALGTHLDRADAKRHWVQVYCTPKGHIAHTTIPCPNYKGQWIWIRWPVVI